MYLDEKGEKKSSGVIVQNDSPSQFSCKVSVVKSHDKGLIA